MPMYIDEQGFLREGNAMNLKDMSNAELLALGGEVCAMLELIDRLPAWRKRLTRPSLTVRST